MRIRSSEWEKVSQPALKDCYERKLAGDPCMQEDPVRKMICETCGQVIYTRMWAKRYCSKACIKTGYQKQLSLRKLTEPRKTLVCKLCGSEFTPKRSDAVYCSNACRQKAYRESSAAK